MASQLKKIRNYESLLNAGDCNARKMALGLLDAVLTRLDSAVLIRNIMKLDGDMLHVGERVWDLSRKKNVYMIGAGKAVNAMAAAVCDILGDRLTSGIVSVKIPEEADRYLRTEVYHGGHPLPNREGMIAAERMIELIEGADSDDLFISVISGGSSALLTCPVEGIGLEDEIVTQDLLLKSGAGIIEINSVRRHISRTNGGRLAEAVERVGAEMINLMVGDWVGSPSALGSTAPYNFYGTPVAPDATTIADARSMIVNYDLADKLPKCVVDFINDDSRITETPKEQSDRIVTFLLAALPDSCDTAARIAAEMGVPCLVLSSYLEGESREVGTAFSSIAREIQNNGRPLAAPCFVVASGETTTKITEPPKGHGGPGHEFVLGFALGAKELHDTAIISIDTEGSDGTTVYAGGIADSRTADRLAARGLNIFEVLREHSTCEGLSAIGDNVFTGNTGTNVCDFNVMYVSGKPGR